jgi:hypothetical protein
MKHLLTFITILAFGAVAQGQITWDNAIADTARGFESKVDIETHNVVTFAQGGTYRWLRTYSEKCKIKTAICDKNSCYLETTDSADFTVTPNESFDMICHFYPYDSCCPEGAMVSLYVFKVDDPSVNSTATYILDLWCETLTVNTVSSNNFTIAPNPAAEQINLLNMPTDVESISVINILGETVLNKNLSVKNMDISELKAGIYWVAVESKGIRYTQRFIKN